MRSYIDECPSWSFPEVYEAEHKPCLRDYIKDERAQNFIRKNGFLLIALLALVIWTWTTTTIAYHNGVVDTREELTAQYEAEKAAAVQAVHDEYAAKRFLTGEASRQAAMAEDATWIAKVLYGMKDNSAQDLRTAVWCILARVDNPWYPDSVEEVCRQKDQWMGFSDTNPVLTDLKDLAMGELDEWYDGERPVGPEFVYLYWTPQKITLRDSWTDGSTTNYWRAG